jgi:hypothetical protein
VRVVRFRPRPISEETGTDEAVVLTCKCRSKFRPGRWSRGLYASERGLTLIYIYTAIHMDRVERQLGIPLRRNLAAGSNWSRLYLRDPHI